MCHFQIQTAILNPDNVNVDPDTQYFTDEELLSRVPNLMLILAGIYLALEMVACAMVTEPTVTCSGGGGGGASCSTSKCAFMHFSFIISALQQ